MELFVLALLIGIGFVAYQYFNPQTQKKSSTIKKSEILEEYENQLSKLDTKEEKIAYIKTINDELSRNIFFDKNEIKEIMQTFIAKSI